MIKIGIIGGSGYTAGELIRILNYHPKVIIKSIVSRNNFGNYVYNIHKDLFGDCLIRFSKKIDDSVDIIFLCVKHGLSHKIISSLDLNHSVKIIDLSQDLRLKKTSIIDNKVFIYGLPEQQKKLIQNSNYISNPGCFATAIQIGILPIAYINNLISDIHISAITGSTGAGKKLIETTNFSWRSNNISNYKIFIHQHLNEIKESIARYQKDFNKKIYFIPYRGNFSRGIIATIYTNINHSFKYYQNIYYNFYKNHPFIHISNNEINLKQVIGTNKCIIHLSQYDNKIIITSIIDNLIKGASGQAVQNLNIMFNIQESYGLKLKPIGI